MAGKRKWQPKEDDMVKPSVVEELPVVELVMENPQPEVMEFQDDDYDEDEVLMTVSKDVSSDPAASPAATLVAIGKLYNDANVVSGALSKHLKVVADQPELFAFMQRVHSTLGDLCHHLHQLDAGMSEELRQAILEAVS